MQQERKLSHGSISLLLIGATILVLVFHTLPARTQREEIRVQLAQATERLTQLGKSANEQREEAGISEIASQELAKAIPSKIAQDKLILDLNEMAQKANVSFNALGFSLNENGDIPSITISGGFEGTPARLIDFLKRLETNPRKLVVQSASMDLGLIIDGNQFATLTLTLQAYFSL